MHTLPSYADTVSQSTTSVPLRVCALTLQSDNPYNTTLLDESGAVAYVLSTDWRSQKRPVTRVHDRHAKLVAEWQWRQYRSDLLSLGGRPQSAANAWLKKSMNGRGMSFKDDRGRKYTWKAGETERSVELYSESSHREPIVRFERSFRDFSDPDVPIAVPAQILYHHSAAEVMDTIIVAFFLIERHRRQRDKGVLNGSGGVGATIAF